MYKLSIFSFQCSVYPSFIREERQGVAWSYVSSPDICQWCGSSPQGEQKTSFQMEKGHPMVNFYYFFLLLGFCFWWLFFSVWCGVHLIHSYCSKMPHVYHLCRWTVSVGQWHTAVAWPHLRMNLISLLIMTLIGWMTSPRRRRIVLERIRSVIGYHVHFIMIYNDTGNWLTQGSSGDT